MLALLFSVAVFGIALSLLAKSDLAPPPPPDELSEKELKRYEAEERKSEQKLAEKARQKDERLRTNRLQMLRKITIDREKKLKTLPKPAAPLPARLPLADPPKPDTALGTVNWFNKPKKPLPDGRLEKLFEERKKEREMLARAEELRAQEQQMIKKTSLPPVTTHEPDHTHSQEAKEHERIIKEHEQAMREKAKEQKRKLLAAKIKGIFHNHEKNDLQRQRAVVDEHLDNIKTEKLNRKLENAKAKNTEDDHHWLFKHRDQELKTLRVQKGLRKKEQKQLLEEETKKRVEADLKRSHAELLEQARETETALLIARKERDRMSHVETEDAKRAKLLTLDRDAHVEIEDAKRNEALVLEGKAPNIRPSRVSLGGYGSKFRTLDKQERARHHDEKTLLRKLIDKEQERVAEEMKELPSFLSTDSLPAAEIKRIEEEQKQISQNAAEDVREQSRAFIQEERRHFKELHRAMKKVKRESLYPLDLQKEHYTHTHFLPKNVEHVMELIGEAREQMLRLKFEKVKQIYIEIMRGYLQLTPQDKARVYREIRELYSERMRAEALFARHE